MRAKKFFFILFAICYIFFFCNTIEYIFQPNSVECFNTSDNNHKIKSKGFKEIFERFIKERKDDAFSGSSHNDKIVFSNLDFWETSSVLSKYDIQINLLWFWTLR
jgi:hypothetical protein